VAAALLAFRSCREEAKADTILLRRAAAKRPDADRAAPPRHPRGKTTVSAQRCCFSGGDGRDVGALELLEGEAVSGHARGRISWALAHRRALLLDDVKARSMWPTARSPAGQRWPPCRAVI